ncbi:hypothetical protein MJ923_14955 [Shewanella sp. 3B26]|uniref:Uncharacterized protein n=1 Tax=Shewanella zhuhaiensis TaxID=2919576 RepID=A0AAJ1BIW9_9GAMM|nr:hypothetical protein [Shewanella zhuhaiensis]MCH4295605.1 hypothetical protein [Shewanella zhuhaiensis]
MDIHNANQIRAALMAKGYSCRTWAQEHGYCPRTVQQYVNLFAPDTGRKPKRQIAKQIIKDLAKTLDVEFSQGEGQ